MTTSVQIIAEMYDNPVWLKRREICMMMSEHLRDCPEHTRETMIQIHQ